jgi:hypothetical protein
MTRRARFRKAQRTAAIARRGLNIGAADSTITVFVTLRMPEGSLGKTVRCRTFEAGRFQHNRRDQTWRICSW